VKSVAWWLPLIVVKIEARPGKFKALEIGHSGIFYIILMFLKIKREYKIFKLEKLNFKF